jgi:AcrR family transcriptional regulator
MNDRPTPSAAHDRILASATRLFLKHGVRAVSVAQIVAEAGVAQMTPYRRFGGKDQLVAAVLEQWGAGWLHSLVARVDRCGDDPAARLAGFWAAVEEWQATEGRHGSLILNAAIELRGEPGHPARAVIEAHQLATWQLLEHLAKQADVDDPTALAAQLQIVLEGALTAAVADRRLPRAASVRAVVEAVLEAERGNAARDHRAPRAP